MNVNYIHHTHTQRAVVADVRGAGDAATSPGRRWRPSATRTDPLNQPILL